MPPRPAPPTSRATLVARGLRAERDGALVFEAVDVEVGPATCLGVVGPNGAGKSTLLQVLAGRLAPVSGRVELAPRGATVGLLNQEHERAAMPVRELIEVRVGAKAAEARLEATAAGLASGTSEAVEAYSDALEATSALGLDTLEARTKTVLAELDLDAAILERSCAALSGGEAARVALAAILLSRYDVLLLDEPTNDLDFAGLGVLEAFVTTFEGALVVVSHDRAFLERCVTGVLELDEHDHRGRSYVGTWSSYLDERATARRHAEDAHALYTRRKKEMTARAQRERQWATSAVRREKSSPRDNDKAQRDFRINRTERLAHKARATERAMEQMEVVDKPFEGWELHLSIGEAARSGAVVCRLEDAVLERGTFRLGPIDLEITWAERLLLAGRNGSGKSTLVGAVLGTVPLASGTRLLGRSVVAGTLGQDRAALFGEASLLEVVRERAGLEGAPARSLLAKLGLGATDVVRPARSLSPGERTRAELAVLQARQVNLLVLDEPTNHLDLPAIEQLEAALATFAGTVLLVSHDRRLLDAFAATRVVDLEACPGTSRA